MSKTPSKTSSKAKPKTAAKKPVVAKSTASRSKTKAVSTRPTAVARKTAARPKPAAKPQLAAVEPDVPRKELKKKELIDRITAKSGMKRGEVRTTLDATLTVLRQALREGCDLSMAPLGKLKIAREKETPNGKLVVCRVKLKDPETTAATVPLAKPAE